LQSSDIGIDWCNGCCAGFWVKLARVTIQLLATACNGVPHLWAHWAAFGGNLLMFIGICLNVPLVWKAFLTGPFLSAGKVIRYLYENGFLFLNVGSVFYCMRTFSFCGKPQLEQLGK